MDYEEEQSMEIEALEAMFPDEVRVERREAPARYFLRVLPWTAGEAENHVEVTLRVTYPAKYPEVVPELSLVDVKALSEDQLNELYDALMETCAENAEMAMIFSVVEKCREWLQEHNEKPSDGSMYAKMLERRKEQGIPPPNAHEAEVESDKEDEDDDDDDDDESGPPSEAVLQARAAIGVDEAYVEKHGTPVNEVTYRIWQQAFEAEMLRREQEDPEFEERRIEKEKLLKKPTGKAIFEEAGSGTKGEAAVARLEAEAERLRQLEDAKEETPDEHIPRATGGGGTTTIDASLFEDEDDDDLSSLEDDE